MFSLLGWMFIWGDNQGQREADIVWYVAVLVAAFFAAYVAVRGIVGSVIAPLRADLQLRCPEQS